MLHTVWVESPELSGTWRRIRSEKMAKEEKMKRPLKVAFACVEGRASGSIARIFSHLLSVNNLAGRITVAERGVPIADYDKRQIKELARKFDTVFVLSRPNMPEHKNFIQEEALRAFPPKKTAQEMKAEFEGYFHKEFTPNASKDLYDLHFFHYKVALYALEYLKRKLP